MCITTIPYDNFLIQILTKKIFTNITFYYRKIDLRLIIILKVSSAVT